MIIDACQSAAFTGENFKPGPMGSRGLGQLAYDKGMLILAATQADNVALESKKLEHGLLTYALVIDGLEGGRADWRPADGALWLSEWLGYAVDRVPTLVEEIRRGKARALVLHGSAPPARVVDKVQQPALFDFTKGRRDVALDRKTN